MKNFASLYKELDETTRPDFKIQSLINYFRSVTSSDAAWAVSLLLGRKIQKIVSVRKLQEWSVELSQIPAWLFSECRDNVGDLTETVSLILPDNEYSETIPLQTLIEEYLIPLYIQKNDLRKEKIVYVWHQLNSSERYIWNKLVSGSFHMDILSDLVIKALAGFCGVDEMIISYRLAGNWFPSAVFFNMLCTPENKTDIPIKPYPFNKAINLNQNIMESDDISRWIIEWNWKGIRTQLIKRENKICVWSKNEDLLNDTFPEIYELASNLPDGTVIDGIIIPLKNNEQLPNSELQKRIVKRYPVKKLLAQIPVSFVAIDIMEFNRIDIRSASLSQRRNYLLNLLNNIKHKDLILSRAVEANSWIDLKLVKNNLNKISSDGLILKQLDSIYLDKVSTPNWFKWKNDPFSILAVLLYARLEQGSTSSLFKEYTFALEHEGKLVPFAKASTGLTDEEIIHVNNFIRNNTLEKFGPVRTVKPELIFRLEFDGVQKSLRHKSGFIVQSPRISYWDHHKKIEEIGSLSSLSSYLDNLTPH
jgi:DNA ligase-1